MIAVLDDVSTAVGPKHPRPRSFETGGCYAKYEDG